MFLILFTGICCIFTSNCSQHHDYKKHLQLFYHNWLKTVLQTASLWTVVTLGLANQKAGKSGAELNEPLLANQSVLLLLVLTNHCCVDGVRNPYREAFFACVGQF